MNAIRSWYKKLNLQNRLRLSYILLILIPVTFLCILYYWVASRSILDIAEQNILDVTVKNMQIIDQQLDMIQEGATLLNVDGDIFEILENLEEMEDSEVLLSDRVVKGTLQKYFPDSYVFTATIMTPRFVFGDNSQMVIPTQNFFDSEFYRRMQGRRGKAQWIPTYQVREEFYLDFEIDEMIFSLVQELNPVQISPQAPGDTRKLASDAVLVVSFTDDVMRNMFGSGSSVEGSFYCVSSRDGIIVSHSDPQRRGRKEELPWLEEIGTGDRGSMVLTYGGQKMVVCYAVSKVTGWVAASVTPVNSLLNNVSRIQHFTVVVWFLLFLTAMSLASVFSRGITRPVEQLVTAMREMGRGEFGRRLPASGTDEMQYLTEKYNEMGERIQTLIRENYEIEIRNKESEIMALNLQMNPHFLYNTLNIINMMALEEGNDEVSKMLISLSEMLQYTFRNRQELVTFKEEYLWLRNYIYIMQSRYEGRFEPCYEVEENVLDKKVPKLLLQPLVENSIIHGFKGIKGGGILTLAASEQRGKMVITVQDNGRGMNSEELEQAMRGDHSRIGLSSAVRRLLLIYEGEGSLEVETEPGEGTTITIRIPALKEQVEKTES